MRDWTLDGGALRGCRHAIARRVANRGVYAARELIQPVVHVGADFVQLQVERCGEVVQPAVQLIQFVVQPVKTGWFDARFSPSKRVA